MRVCYDHQIFSMQRTGGISQYFSRLIEYFTKMGDPEVCLAFRFFISEHLTSASNRFYIPRVKGTHRLCRLLDDYYRVPVSGDLVHSTYYDPKYIHAGDGKPKVVTVHDMIPELLPEYFRRNPHLAKRDYVDAASRIICISNTTKNDLVSIYNVPDDKIDVIHHGVDIDAASADISYARAPARYILYIGNRDGYKNFGLLLEAMIGLWRGGSDISLLCVGGGPLSRGLAEAAGRYTRNMS